MSKAKTGWKATLRVKMTSKDAHYSGGLVAGARILELFGDAATRLCLREAGVEGLLRAYKEAEFLAPVYSGDTVEASAIIIRVGNTSRTMRFIAFKNIPSSPPLKLRGGRVGIRKKIVCKAIGTVVISELKHR